MSVDLEKILRPIPAEMAPYEPKYMLLASGEAAVVRAVDRDEIPDLLKHVEPPPASMRSSSHTISTDSRTSTSSRCRSTESLPPSSTAVR